MALIRNLLIFVVLAFIALEVFSLARYNAEPYLLALAVFWLGVERICNRLPRQ